MAIQQPRPWFSLYSLAPYQGPEPPFYPAEDMPWKGDLEAATRQIQQELRRYLKRHPPVPYFAANMASSPTGWSTIPLMTWGLRYRDRLKHFPGTMKALAEIPGLVSVSFNLLRPGSSISPHFGDTNAAMRVHLGLDIPAGLPDAGLQVHDERRGWRTGEAIGFCDGYVHWAWNHTSGDRWVLLLDVIRPRYRARQRHVCASVLSSLTLQLFMRKIPGLKVAILLPLRLIATGGTFAAFTLTPAFNLISRWRAR